MLDAKQKEDTCEGSETSPTSPIEKLPPESNPPPPEHTGTGDRITEPPTTNA